MCEESGTFLKSLVFAQGVEGQFCLLCVLWMSPERVPALDGIYVN